MSPAGPEGMPLDRFRRDVLSDLLALANPKAPSTRHKHDARRCDELEARTGQLSAQEQADLGAYLIRLRQYDKAIRVLSSPAALDHPLYAALANLGTAYQQTGQLDSAAFSLQRLKRRGRWEGLPDVSLAWYRRAEEYHLRLVLLRNGELRLAPGQGPRPPEHVDDLFGPVGSPVHFVGESGHYEAGRIAANERRKLPSDAIALVEQLLVWLPEDTRLYWLLGELFNASGDVQAAATVMEDCVWNRGWTAEELKDHRRILKEARPAPALDVADLRAPPAARTTPPPTDWLPSRRRAVAVAVIAAAAMAALTIFQIRELRRRRRRPPPS